MKSTYPDERLKLMWLAFKMNKTATKAERWLFTEHQFEVSKVTLLRYLRDGLLNRFADTAEELLQVKNDVYERKGARCSGQGKTVARKATKVARITEKALSRPDADGKVEEREDLKGLNAFYQERLALLPTSLRYGPGNCKYPTNDTPGKIEFCSCHTVEQLFGSKTRVPSALSEFGSPMRAYCLMHAYIVVQKSSKIRLMGVISPAALVAA